MLVLDSTNDTIVSLIETYQRFSQEYCQSKEISVSNSDAIDLALEEKRMEVCSSKKKVQTLHAKLKSTIKLVSWRSSLLEIELNRIPALEPPRP